MKEIEERGGKPAPQGKIIRAKQLAEMLGIGRSTLYDWQNRGSPRFDPTFPRRIRLGKGSVGWLLDEINMWIATRAQYRQVA
ncbi:AlpA family transcriptional regulator [uncultured Zoogloea sp.]|uniref:helix-turn-helix transcriptional regulator n=1 Tax=uncultured Zoogloea sp. TaxID=160237 RepID=UPI00260AA05C|nr:AlpA family phage regulatory protein [uncultured Zoogloea sp.]